MGSSSSASSLPSVGGADGGVKGDDGAGSDSRSNNLSVAASTRRDSRVSVFAARKRAPRFFVFVFLFIFFHPTPSTETPHSPQRQQTRLKSLV